MIDLYDIFNSSPVPPKLAISNNCQANHCSHSHSQGVEHLKPHVVHSLANAELYCLALSHLYADPNYHNLNHWGVIQVLARKGIFVAEPADCSLTETVLIQTTPLKMVMMRHCAVNQVGCVIADILACQA